MQHYLILISRFKPVEYRARTRASFDVLRCIPNQEQPKMVNPEEKGVNLIYLYKRFCLLCRNQQLPQNEYVFLDIYNLNSCLIQLETGKQILKAKTPSPLSSLKKKELLSQTSSSGLSVP